MRKYFVLTTYFALTAANVAFARPIFTEDVATLGKSVFEAGFNGSARRDEFNSPTIIYNTVRLPVRARLGLTPTLDFGFSLTHLSHSLEMGSTKLKGSRTALFSPELKLSPKSWLGFLAIWHNALKEKPAQDIPIARGDNYEFSVLLQLPFKYKSYLNLGYVMEGSYKSRLGIENGSMFTIEPGDIFQTKASVEIPIKSYFSLLTELAYYDVQSKKIGTTEVEGSAGTALDALVGLVWENKGWNIALGSSFGLLDESHTSFDLEHGSGDITYHLNFSYRLKARKPYQ